MIHNADLKFADKLISMIAVPTCIICSEPMWLVNPAMLSLLEIDDGDLKPPYETIFSESVRLEFASLHTSTEVSLPKKQVVTLSSLKGKSLRVLLNVDRLDLDSGRTCLILTVIEVLDEQVPQQTNLVDNDNVVYVEWHRGEYNLMGYVSNEIKQFGYEPQEFVDGPHTFNDIIHPSDVNWLKQSIDRVMDNKLPYVYWEYRIICRNGEVRWVGDFTVMQYQHPIISSISYLLDITPFRRAHDALQSSRQMYRQLARHLPDMNVVLFNRELRFMVIEGQLSLIPKSAEGKTVRDTLKPALFERLLPLFRGVLAGKAASTEETIDGHHYTLMFLPIEVVDARQQGMLVIKDVTEERRVQNDLRESRERLDNLIDSIDDVIWSIQPDPFKVLYISDSAEKLFGYTMKDFNASPDLWDGIAHPDDQKQVTTAQVRLPDNGESDLETRIIRKDGEIRWVHSRAKAKYDDEGKIIRIDGITRDITESKLAEDALRTSEERFRQIAENINEVFYIFKNDRFVYVSPAFEMIWKRPGDLIYKDAGAYMEWIHPEDRQSVLDALRQDRWEKTPLNIEYRIVHPDGTIRWLWARNFPVEHTDEVYHVVGVAEDITDQKQARESLRESEELYRLIATNVGDMIARNDPTTTFTYVSPSSLNVMGYTPEELIGTKASDYVHPDDRHLVPSFSKAITLNPVDISGEFRVKHKDGYWIWVESTGRLISDDKGEVVGSQFVTRDITGRKLSEDALRESEERFRQIAENVAEVFYIFSKDRFIYISPAYEKIWQRDINEAYADPSQYLDAVVPEDREMVKAGIVKQLDDLKTFEMEYRIARPDGEIRWIWARNFPVAEHQDDLYLVGIAEDVTERKKSLIALEKSEARFQQIAENITEVFFVRDVKEDRYVYVSPAYEKIWQRPIQQLYDDPMTLFDQVHPDDVGSLKTDYLERFKRSRVNDTEYRIIRDDGELRWIHVRSYPLEDEHGELAYYVGTAEDITERKQALIALEESEERLQLAVETGNLGTWDWNLETDEIKWNDQHYLIWGLDPEGEPITRAKMSELTHFEDADRLSEAFIVAYQTGVLARTEFRIIRPDGEIRWIASQGQVYYDNSGTANRILGIVQDITELKQNEQRRIELALAEERSNLLTEFLGNISHDLRTPLTVINTSLDMIERYALDEERRHRKIEVIRIQTQQLESMIQNILTMSQLDHNPQMPLAPFSLNHTLKEILLTLAGYAEMRDVKLSADYDTHIPVTYASEGHLYRAFTNLLKNGINYTKKGGEVKVKTLLDGQHVVIKISDTGIGIAPQDLARIFDRFYRVDKARPSDDGGTGLGLAIVKRIVEMHDGDISVDSEPGKGTTFTITLPLRDKDVKYTAPSSV